MRLEPDQSRSEKLIRLAQERFSPELLYAEVKVLRDSASSQELPWPVASVPQPEVRASFLRWLLTDCDAAPLIDPKGVRVFAATITGSLDLDEYRKLPTIYLRRCEIGELISLLSAQACGIYIVECCLRKGIRADRIVVQGPFFLRRVQSMGPIRVSGSEIKGNFDCAGAILGEQGNDSDSLSLDGACISGNVFLNRSLSSPNRPFTSFGLIHLNGATIKGDLDCAGANLKAKGDALVLDGAHVDGNVFLNLGLTSAGLVRLNGAQIKGDFDCSNAQLDAAALALSLERATVSGNLYLNQRFVAHGILRMTGAQVGGDLDFYGAALGQVYCDNMQVKGDLIWRGIREAEACLLSLTGATVKNLRDDRASWPSNGKLILDGLVYEELTAHESPRPENIDLNLVQNERPLDADERINWLMLQSADRRTEPQPWMQLSRHLDSKSAKVEAKHVLYKLRVLQSRELEWHPLLDVRTAWGRLRKVLKLLLMPRNMQHPAWPYLRHPNRSWAIAFAWLEEAPQRILYSIVFTLLIGTLIFAGASPTRSHAMMPVKKEAKESPAGSTQAKPETPPFQPFVYTLENALPLVKLGMDDNWVPDPNHQGQGWFPSYRWLNWLGWFNSYWFLAVSRWILILSGWFQATVLAAALANRFKS